MPLPNSAEARQNRPSVFIAFLVIFIVSLYRRVNRQTTSTHTYIFIHMSRSSWRSAEALQNFRREQQRTQRRDEAVRFRRLKAIREWEITGEPPFRSKEYSYPSGGGVKGVGGFLRAADLALHLHDRSAEQCYDI